MAKSAARSIRNNIMVGLVLVTPLVITAFVVNWLFRFITNNFLIFLPKDLHSTQYELLFRCLALFFVLFVLFFIGLLIRNILGKRLYQLGDHILTRIPVVSRIYISVRQVIEALFMQRQTLFTEVVFLEYPRQGVYSLGFVTAVAPPETVQHLKKADSEYLSVFIPTTPNPTSGWFCLIPRSQTISVPISTGDAMKLIISGGAVFPGQEIQLNKPTLLDKLNEWVESKKGG